MLKYLTLGLLAMGCVTVLLSGCGPGAPPFDPRAVQQAQREAASGTAPYPMRPLPTTVPALMGPSNEPLPWQPLPSASRAQGPELRLSLRELIHRALLNNPDIRVAGYQPAIDEYRILEAMARFDPVVRASYQFQQQYSQSTLPFTVNPGQINANIWEASVGQTMATGAEARMTWRTVLNRFETVNDRAFPTPIISEETIWDNQLVFQLTQPLLRDFGTKVNRARIFVARNDQRISELDFRDAVEKVVQQIEETYWDLVRAERDFEILQRIRDQSLATLVIIQIRMIQDASALELHQAEADLRTREADLVRARYELQELSDQLKRLMGDPDVPTAGPIQIRPADAPVTEPVQYALTDQLEAAFANRLDLEQQLRRIDNTRIIVDAARNNELPRLNLGASVGFQGLGDGFDDAFRSQRDGDFINYGIGVQFEWPLGNREARAITERTRLAHAQATERYRQLLQQVELEVTVAHRRVAAAWDLIIAHRLAVGPAANYLAGLQHRQDHGEPLTPNFVRLKLDAQAQLARAQQLENQAIAQYNIALAALEKQKGTLLRYNNILLSEAPRPRTGR
jgi:outer membrane protein